MIALSIMLTWMVLAMIGVIVLRALGRAAARNDADAQLQMSTAEILGFATGPRGNTPSSRPHITAKRSAPRLINLYQGQSLEPYTEVL